MASITAKGNPSERLLKTTMSEELYAFSGSLVAPMNWTCSSSCNSLTLFTHNIE